MRHEGHLLRVLGLVFGVAAVVGSVVGQGILRSPGAVAEASTSPWVIMGLWLVGALLSMVSAMPYAELGAAIPSAGGPYAYTVRAFGQKAGVAVAYSTLMYFFTSVALTAFVLGEFLVRIGVGEGKLGPGVLAMASLALFCAINAAGTRVSGASQVVLSALKGMVLLGLVVIFLANPGTAAVTASAAETGPLVYVTAIVLIIGTYMGWGDVVLYGEEIENPGRSIPRALFGGIAGVAVLYLLVNFALLHLLGGAGMAGSEFAAADAAGMVFGERGDLVLTTFGILSVGAITSIGLMSSTRMTYAAARAGLLPHVLVKVGRRGTPIRALLLVAMVAALFIASGTYLAVASAAVAIAQFNLIAVSASAIALRRREPDMPRPYRMPLFAPMIVVGLVANIVLLAALIIEDPIYGLSGFVLVGLAWAGYWLFASGSPRALTETEESA
jgi:APA family basic amino acid/polyamine antiporter